MKDSDIDYIFTILEKVNFQIIGTALLAILIPLVIGILNHFYQKKKDQTEEFAILDLHVILDEIFKFKWLLFFFALIFLPTMFWETFSSSGSHFIESILSIAGVYFVVKTLLKIYRWVKGNVTEFRFSYLSYLNNQEDMEAVWPSVWQADKTNFYNEREFFRIFSLKVDQLLKTDEKFITTSKLLDDFKNFINNRSVLVLVNVMLHKILEWHYRIWEKEYEYLGKGGKLKEWSSYSEVSGILNSILKKIEERSLKERGAFSFFDGFKKHAEKHKGKFIKGEKGKEYYYINSLLSIFYRVFFENIETSSERYDIWEHYFPKEWKVTKTHLESEENIIARVSLNKFLQWAQERMWQAKEEFDRKLDDVASNLFPEIEPRVWAPVLIFRFSPYGDNRVKSVIERPWNFGGASRVFSGCGEENLLEMMELQIESEKKNTFKLATVLFKDTFSKENLACYIKDLKGLEGTYKNDSSEEDKRSSLLGIFTEMLNFLNV